MRWFSLVGFVCNWSDKLTNKCAPFVFAEDAAIFNSYSIGNSTSVALMECGSKKQVLKSAVLARRAVRQACVKRVVGKAVKTLASIQM
jgi:hypothetical protein